MKHVLVVFGTRPEAIKMAPVVHSLRQPHVDVRTTVCVTAQHREMLDQVLALFGIHPEFDLGLMRPGQSLAHLTAAAVTAVDGVLQSTRPDVVLVHGDTTTAMVTALAAFYRQIPIGHVEAGLRSGRMDAPFPEEMNRVFVDRVAAEYFAPTPRAADNLRAEGVASDRITVTGNTAIDALLSVRARLPQLQLQVRDQFSSSRRVILVTAHRREAFGLPFLGLLQGLDRLARSQPDLDLVYPVHLNPNVQGPVRARLTAPNVRLIDPVDYASLVWLLDRSEFVLTDSGGIQEEAPALGKPVLVLRDVTERPELLEAGAGILVGTDPDRIHSEATRLLCDAEHYARMSRCRDIFGDGRAGERIVARLSGQAVDGWPTVPRPATRSGRSPTGMKS